jgi:hypothetical protein
VTGEDFAGRRDLEFGIGKSGSCDAPMVALCIMIDKEIMLE